MTEGKTTETCSGRPHPLTPPNFPPIDIDKAVAWCQGKTGKQLAPSQQAALRQALSSRVLIITGDPGVGKTTLVNATRLLLALNEAGKQPAMNLGLARVYLKHSDPMVAQRTWQHVLDEIVKLKSGPTQYRWQTASPPARACLTWARSIRLKCSGQVLFQKPYLPWQMWLTGDAMPWLHQCRLPAMQFLPPTGPSCSGCAAIISNTPTTIFRWFWNGNSRAGKGSSEMI